ncbi:MAG: hypothetical protein L6R37_008029 [Teloschistes peruensis]|nr:MAG: hypothetical protein L6R37_008029 [Teloschistes peruensis]
MDSVTKIQGPTYSDGDASHRPTNRPDLRKANEQGYLQKLALKWMQEVGMAKIGKNYSLDQLPAGYEVWERPRTNDPNHFDKWLFGHPNHKTFDSPNRFFPHFVYLMRNGSENCTCKMCNVGNSKSLPVPMAEPSPQKAPLHKGPVDEQGMPDVFQHLFTLLKSEGTLTREIEEPFSMDWRAEQPLVEAMANSTRESYIPRHGEIVMYLKPRPFLQGHELRQDISSHEFKVYDTKTSQYIGTPQWLAGIVAEMPPLIPPNMTVFGFRIEPLPTPGSKDQGINKEHTYAPINLIRPFAFWQTCLHGIPEDQWHQSIHNALAACKTVSLIDRHIFKGFWPTAKIYSRAIFVGAENYWIGDTVRLLPKAVPLDTVPSNTVTVMQIRNIVTTLLNLRPEADGHTVTGDECESITITLEGHVYTLSKPTTNDNVIDLTDEDEEDDDATILPTHAQKPVMHDYERDGYRWHRLLPPNPHPTTATPGDTDADADENLHSTTFSGVLSRLYEHTAMHTWFPALHLWSPPPRSASTPTDPNNNPTNILSCGTASMMVARGGKEWFWADGRVEALGLTSLCGMRVGVGEGVGVGEVVEKQAGLEEKQAGLGTGGGGRAGGSDEIDEIDEMDTGEPVGKEGSKEAQIRVSPLRGAGVGG